MESDDGPSATVKSGARPAPGSKRSYARKVTYVSPGKAKGEGEETRFDPSPIDVAGVARVLQFEQDAGRTPTEMPHSHPGYDVCSRDSHDRVARVIEVKSHQNDWGDPALSRRQFTTAQELGPLYWLYVVERADQPDFRITCIQDPANQVNTFAYDENWKLLHQPGQGEDGLDGNAAHGMGEVDVPDSSGAGAPRVFGAPRRTLA